MCPEILTIKFRATCRRGRGSRNRPHISPPQRGRASLNQVFKLRGLSPIAQIYGLSSRGRVETRGGTARGVEAWWGVESSRRELGTRRARETRRRGCLSQVRRCPICPTRVWAIHTSTTARETRRPPGETGEARGRGAATNTRRRSLQKKR